MKIATIIGARPQFIKASMISKEIAKNVRISEVIIHTGQHFDDNMSQVFFDEMDIPDPDYILGIQSLTHGAMTGRQLEEIEKVLFIEKPDLVLVYGDTNSTLAGSLAAAKLDIPVAHVEAGIRSFNRSMPEEINRVLTDHLAELLFVPTDTAIENLKREGIDKSKIRMVGDVMYDASLYFGKIAENKSNILDKLQIKSKEYILSTIHRQGNTDDPIRLKNIFSAIAEAPFPVVLPLHPRTKKKLADTNIILNRKLRIIEPVGYLDMLMLERNANKIVTDSGGVQKEAFFYQVPCITLRDETEWVELIDAGVNNLAGANKEKILRLMNDQNSVKSNESFYGDGSAAKKILKEVLK